MNVLFFPFKGVDNYVKQFMFVNCNNTVTSDGTQPFEDTFVTNSIMTINNAELLNHFRTSIKTLLAGDKTLSEGLLRPLKDIMQELEIDVGHVDKTMDKLSSMLMTEILSNLSRIAEAPYKNYLETSQKSDVLDLRNTSLFDIVSNCEFQESSSLVDEIMAFISVLEHGTSTLPYEYLNIPSLNYKSKVTYIRTPGNSDLLELTKSLTKSGKLLNSDIVNKVSVKISDTDTDTSLSKSVAEIASIAAGTCLYTQITQLAQTDRLSGPLSEYFDAYPEDKELLTKNPFILLSQLVDVLADAQELTFVLLTTILDNQYGHQYTTVITPKKVLRERFRCGTEDCLNLVGSIVNLVTTMAYGTLAYTAQVLPQIGPSMYEQFSSIVNELSEN